jgi:hypothetical protein
MRTSLFNNWRSTGDNWRNSRPEVGGISPVLQSSIRDWELEWRNSDQPETDRKTEARGGRK